MKKILFIMMALMLGTATVDARTQWTIRDVLYDVDTVIYPHQVGPGMISAKYNIAEIPLMISVLEMDLTNPYAMMEPCLGGGAAVGCETPPSMAARNNWPGHDVVGAINGDFFLTMSSKEMGTPTSGQVTNGELQVSSHNRACFILDDSKHPHVDRLTFTGTVTSGSTTFPLNLVNRMRYTSEGQATNQSILFTHAFGSSTYAGSTTGKMLILRPAGDAFKWSPNGTEHCVIEKIQDSHHSTPIPEGGAILLLRGSYADYAASLHAGDELDITFKLQLNNNPIDGNIEQLIGGSDHLFMRNGEYTGEAWDDRHPRTAIGFSADSTRLFFVVVDGRHTSSAGATMKDMVGVFQGLGAAFGVNLDGGGSSSMVVNDELINHPSDGPIRSVGNGCLFVSTAPPDDAIGLIRFEPRRFNLPVSASMSFAVWGYNQYGVLKTRDLQGCTFSCDPQLGHFDENGVFFASSTPAVGNLYATYNDLTVTQPVSIMEAEWKFESDSVVIDKFHDYTIGINGVSAYGIDKVDPTVVDWMSSDESVCVVNDEAVVSAVDDGITYVGSSTPLLTSSLLVRVENPKAEVTTIENAPIDPSTWTISQSGGKNRVATTLENGMQIDFTGASSRNSYIKLSKAVQMWGLPDTLRLRMQPGGITLKSLKMLLTTARGKRVTVEYPINGGDAEEVTVNVPVADICNPSDLGNFPLHLVYYYITHEQVNVGESYSLKIPGMEMVYASLQEKEPEPILGDVNNDGEISLADLNVMIDLIMRGEYLRAADVEQDGEINIADVNLMIDIILFS